MKNRRNKFDDGAQLTLPTLVHYAPVLVPQSNGDYLIKAGKPVVSNTGPEVTVREFKRLTGLSLRHIQRLCDEGHIEHRRKTPLHKSEILIPRAEALRYRQITETQEKPCH